VWRPIPFGARRKRQTAGYSRRHYDMRGWRLEDPQVIVEHYTDGTSFDSAWNHFAANGSHLGEKPGVCSHFLIDTDGTIYQLVNLRLRCRHAIGMNWTAIGVEHVGTSADQVLGNADVMRASLRLTVWLMARYGFATLLVPSAIPNPTFELAGITAGAVRMNFWRFLLAVGIGKTIRAILLVVVGDALLGLFT
jgi:beta-N-acetylhexosaminidase